MTKHLKNKCLFRHIYLAGGSGMVGNAVKNFFLKLGFRVDSHTHSEIDLTDPFQVSSIFKDTRYDLVINCAGQVGGILANIKYPADLIYKNCLIQSNLLDAAFRNKVDRYLSFGSACMYPKYSKQPVIEEEVLNGVPELTNLSYGVSKIFNVILSESYRKQYGFDCRVVTPTNLYGPGDTYHTENSHVIPAMIMKFHDAKINNSSVRLLGSGKPLREFLYIDDLVSAIFHILNLSQSEFERASFNGNINIGSGEEVSILNLSKMISAVVEYDGDVEFDVSAPDGIYRKALNANRLNQLGWVPSFSIRDGLKLTYKDYLHGL